MFSKQSRYRRLPDVAAVRRDGRRVAAKELRELPDVTGSFTHTVAAGDRLDQLAFVYYGQPLQYWRICDANPEFLSPLALLGQEPLTTTTYAVTVPDPAPPWAEVLAALSALVGVEEATVREDRTLRPAVEPVEGQDVKVVREHTSPVVTVRHNRAIIDGAAIATAIERTRLAITAHSEDERTGRQIVIPGAVQGQARP